MLTSYGIPFSTVKCLLREPAHTITQQSIGLGRCKLGHKFDIIEYLAYEKAKNDVLSSSIGCMVLTKDGIIWRLAKNIVRYRAVLQGPSESANVQGNVVGHLGSHLLIDNKLQTADEDIICGVYHLPTGIYYIYFVFFLEPLNYVSIGNNHVAGAQMTEVSWWPKALI
jgi:hypothetical protein